MAYKKIGLVAVFDTAQFMPNVTKFLGSIDRMNKAVTEAASSTGALSAPVASLGKGFGTLSLVVGAIVSSRVFAALGDQLKHALEQAAIAAKTFQLLEQRFTTLAARDYMREFGGNVTDALEATTGSAQSTIEWLRRLSVTTPYTVESLSSLYTFAQAAGFTEAEVKVLAQTIGDFAAGMGLTSEHVDRIIWNFSQMKSAGRVLGRELRDLGNSMVPVDYLIEKLAYEFKVTKEQMKEMLQSGEVDADKFIQTFNEMSTEEFEGAMQRVSNTWYFAKANMKDFIDTMLGLDIIKPTLDELSVMMNKFLQSLMTTEARRSTIMIGLALKEAFLTATDVIKNYALPAFKELMASFGIGKPTALGFAKGILNIGFAFKTLIVIASKVTSHIAAFIETITKSTEDELTDTAEDAYGWGANIVIMFAEGMASAIGFILDALTAIADTFIKWLAPGSPPLLLPDLTEWGAGAMTAYMEGWREGDFSVFDDIASMIEKYINSFDLEPEDSLSRIFGSREELAAIIDQYEDLADVPPEIISQITDAAGIASDVMNDYIASMFELQSVLSDAADAEAIFDFELGQLDTGLESVIDTLDEAKQAALDYQGVGSGAILAYVDALEQMSVAQINLKSAQDELNATTKYYDDLLADLYAQQNKLNDDIENSTRLKAIDKTLSSVILTADERERLELEKRGILLKREIRDTELARDQALEAANGKVDASQLAYDAAKESADAQKKLAEDILKATQEQVEGQVKAYEHLLNVTLDNMKLIEDAKKASERKGGGGEEPLGEDVSFGAGTAATNVDDITAGIQDAIDRLKKTLEEKWNNLTKDLLDPFLPLQQQIDSLETRIEIFKKITWPQLQQYIQDHPILFSLEVLGGVTLAIGLAALVKTIRKWLFVTLPALIWAGIKSAVKTLLAKAWLDISTRVGVFFLDLGPKIAGWLIPAGATAIALLSGYLALAVLVLIQVIKQFGPGALETLKTIGKIISVGWTYFVGPWFQEAGKNIADWATNAYNDIASWVTNAGSDIATWATNTYNDVASWATNTYNDIASWVTNAGEDISTWVTNAGEDISTWVTNAGEDISTWVTNAGEDISTWATNAGEDISTWVTNAGEDISTWVTNAGDDISTWVTDAGKDISTWVTNAGTDISTWVTNAGTDISTWVTNAGTDISTWVTNAGEDISTWATDAGEDISTWVSDAKTDFSSWATDTGKSISDWVTNVGKVVLDFFAEDGKAYTITNDFIQFGKDLIGGIISGLWQKAVDLYNAIRDIIRRALTAGEDEADLGSPSKEFEKQSVQWIAGLIKGIKENEGSLENAIGNLVYSILGITDEALFADAMKEASAEMIAVAESPSVVDKFSLIGKSWVLGIREGFAENSNLLTDFIYDLLPSSFLNTAGKRTIMPAPSTSFAVPTKSTTYNQIINVSMNPTYENVQSPSSVYYDLTAALASIRR